MFRTAEPLWRWHEANEAYLVARRPVATVGLVWSQRNMDFFGRDDGDAHVDDPWNGFSQALIRARIPYVPVHIDDIERVTAELGLRLLILPNLAAISDAQVVALRAFVAGGGNLLATGLSSLCNEWGEARSDFALADLFGAHAPATHAWRDDIQRTAHAKDWSQTYLRLPTNDARHETLRAFGDTDVLAFGGVLESLRVDPHATVALTYVPPVPVTPAENVWMREPRTDVPGLIFNTLENGSRIVYLPADIDRRFARDYIPDHGDLLAYLVRWAVKDDLPLRVDGPGLIDCHLYTQPGRFVLHLVNLTNVSTWRTPVHELVPIGPVRIRVRTANASSRSKGRSLVSNASLRTENRDGWCEFEAKAILDHEVVVLEHG